MRRAVAVLVALAAGALTAGCESAAEEAADKQLDSSQRQVPCATAAVPVAPPPGVAPSVAPALPMPQKAVLFRVDDRGKDGIVLSAVTSEPFKDVLAGMNAGYSANGFKITGGETEEHDAEANWTVDGRRGRWAIREIGSQCPGDTLVTVLVSQA